MLHRLVTGLKNLPCASHRRRSAAFAFEPFVAGDLGDGFEGPGDAAFGLGDAFKALDPALDPAPDRSRRPKRAVWRHAPAGLAVANGGGAVSGTSMSL